MSFVTEEKEKDLRLSKAVTIELNKVKSGQEFLFNEVFSPGPISHTEKVRVPERYMGTQIATPVADSDQDHVFASLTSFKTREAEGFNYKLEAKMTNAGLSEALYTNRFGTSFSPAQAAKDFLEQGGLELRSRISASFELDVCNILQTGVSERNAIVNVGTGAVTKKTMKTGIAYETWQKPTITNTTSWKNYKVDPCEVLRNLVKKVKDNGGAMPKNVYLGYEAADALRSNPKTREAINTLNLIGNRFEQKYFDGVSAEYIGRLAGLELYEYSGSYTNDAGVSKHFINKNSVILTPEKRLKTAQFCWGRVNRFEINKPVTYFLKTVPNEKKGNIDVIAEACGIPFLLDRKSFLCATLTGNVIPKPEPTPAPNPATPPPAES